MTESALEGVKVLEYCELVAGPYCTKLLADLGAEVIKVESPGHGDGARHIGPFWQDIPSSEGSGLFFYLNANKLGITLDPMKPEGKQIFGELVKRVDILVEDKSPNLMKAGGLDYESLQRLNPSLIVTSITPFGQTGPYKGYKAYPLNTFHCGGEGYLTPVGPFFRDRPPVKVGRFAGEYFCGWSAAGATLMALLHQRITGRGQHVDISKQESMLYLSGWDHRQWPNEGRVVNRMSRGYYIHKAVFECLDGYVIMNFHAWPQQWLNFLKVVAYPGWDNDERLKNRSYCQEHWEEIRQVIADLLKERTKDELYREALANNAPLAPVFKIKDVMDSPQMRARGFFAEIIHPEWGKLKYPTAPYRFSETPWQQRLLSPSLGKHNEAIYRQYLGLCAGDLSKLRKQGII